MKRIVFFLFLINFLCSVPVYSFNYNYVIQDTTLLDCNPLGSSGTLFLFHDDTHPNNPMVDVMSLVEVHLQNFIISAKVQYTTVGKKFDGLNWVAYPYPYDWKESVLSYCNFQKNISKEPFDYGQIEGDKLTVNISPLLRNTTLSNRNPSFLLKLVNNGNVMLYSKEAIYRNPVVSIIN